MTRVDVDDRLCEGYGFCVRVAPDVFELADDGTARVSAQPSTDEDAAAVARAVRTCPQLAIRVQDG